MAVHEVTGEIWMKLQDTEIETIQLESGYNSAMIILVIKWFFIEQDIRYWNYSGRNMFMLAVPAPVQ